MSARFESTASSTARFESDGVLNRRADRQGPGPRSLVGAAIIEGLVEGNLKATRSVEVHHPGQVKGDITTPSLFLDKDVVFEGNCQMTEPAR